MIRREVYEDVVLQTIHKGASVISEDVREAFMRAVAIETSPTALDGLKKTYDSLLISQENGFPACPDTGWPVFYFKVGNECIIEGGFMELEESTRRAVEKGH